MPFTIQNGEEIHKIYRDNKYVGYLDNDENLFGINTQGYAEKVDSDVEKSKAVSILQRWLDLRDGKKAKRDKNREIDIIRSMVARLSVYENTSVALENARKYLKEVGK